MIQVVDVGDVAAGNGVGAVIGIAGIEIIGQEAVVVADRLAEVGRRSRRGNAQVAIGQIAPQGIRECARECTVDDGVFIRRAFLVLQRDVVDQVELRGLTEQKAERGAAGLGVFIAQGPGLTVAARRDRRWHAAQAAGAIDADVVERLEITVRCPAGEREARVHNIRDECHIGHRARVDAVEIAKRHLRVARVIALRFHGNHAHGAALGILAEQGALWAAQYFHALQVEQIEHRALRAPNIDIVDVDRYARLER